MSNNATYIGQKMQRFDSAREFEAYSSVDITSPDGETSGGEIGGGGAGHLPGMPTQSGLQLTAETPWGTSKMRSNMLQQILGFKYQPFTAEGALLDPAAELGDGVTADNVYSGIYTRTINFGTNTTATVSAPIGEDLDHEFPYVPKQDRKVQRRLQGLTTQLSVTDGKISAEVSNLEQKMNTELAVRDGEISAKVSKQKEDYKTQAFGWSLTENAWQLLNNGTVVFKVNADGALIKGKVTATSGKIGGFTIEKDYLSYKDQTWEGTVTNGGYLGVKGIQLGTKFKVDMQGNLTAKSGSFEGTITAKSGSIGGFAINEKYLNYDGLSWSDKTKESGIYLGSSGLKLGQNFEVDMKGNLTANNGTFGGTVKANKIVFDKDDESSKLPGSALKLSSVGSGILSSGVNTSLDYANFSNLVFSGKDKADHVWATGATFEDSLTFKGWDVRWADMYDSSGTKYTVLVRSYE